MNFDQREKLPRNITYCSKILLKLQENFTIVLQSLP